MEDAVERILRSRRRRTSVRARVLAVAAALALHAALTATAVVLPMLGTEERRPMEFVSVQIVPAAVLGTPRPARPAPPVPEPPEEEEEPAPEPEPEAEEEPPPPEPEPQPDVPALPTREAPEPEPEPEPRRRQPAEEPAAAPDARRGSPTGSATGTSALGASVAAVGDPTFTYGYYLDRVLAAIEQQWRRPPTDGVPLEVALDFRIRRDGRVVELDVAESSGLNAFDLAGLRAVQSAAPLPPLPAGYRQDSLAIRLIIR